MVDQFIGIAIQSNIPLARKRDEFRDNIKHLLRIIDNAYLTTSIELPPKLVVLPEASFQGFRDEFIDQDHLDYVQNMSIEIPGEETDLLAEKAKQLGIFLVATAKARMTEFPDRFFNIAFIIGPNGNIVHKHTKNQVWVREHSTTPHDVYDEWVKIFGDGLDAFFPVARTEIGNIGTTICMEGSFPEPYRGLAINGAEIITRVAYPEPWVSQGQWEIQNRARALDNQCYMVCANHGTMLRRGEAMQPIGGGNGGRSMLIDYRGQILSETIQGTETFTAGIINVDALRDHRKRAKFMNFLPYLKTEIYQSIYKQQIWPKNLALGKPPGKHAEVDMIFERTVKELQRRGTFASQADNREK